MSKKYYIARVVEVQQEYEAEFYYLFTEEPTFEQVVELAVSDYKVKKFDLEVTIEELETTEL